MKPQPQSQATKDRPIPSIGRMQTGPLDFLSRVRRLQGPVLVVGAQEFGGANLLKTLLQYRQDVYGTTPTLSAWRLRDVAKEQLRKVDLLSDTELAALLDEVKPRTVFNCTSYETPTSISSELIYKTRFLLTQRLLSNLSSRDIASFLQINCATIAVPTEQDMLAVEPDILPGALADDYDLADEATTRLIESYGMRKRIPCASIKLLSPYGPLLDPTDAHGPLAALFQTSGTLPEALSGSVANSVYINDACEAIVLVASSLSVSQYGLTFDVGAAGAHINEQAYTVQDFFGWGPSTGAANGLESTLDWFHSVGELEGWRQLAGAIDKAVQPRLKNSVSAVIACYNEGLSIPIMYQRLRDTFVKLGIDYEIIFVNNASTDNSEQLITAISAEDPRVIGITHSRSFDSQASFKSGMELASKEACVLLDGDLQDPPELIEQFVEKWREGYDVVYGRRVRRDAPWFMQLAYKAFYRVFSYFSYVTIPNDAGDFSLIDMRVVRHLIRFTERDLFLRGLRAYVGFRQIGVDYMRPERLFGKTSNNLLKNIGWAKKGIFSFTKVPLDILSYFGVILFFLSIVLGLFQVALRLLFPESTAWGVTTILVTILFFGSINLFAISLIGEYIAKIFDEVKQRPSYIRRNIIQAGEIKPVNDVFPIEDLKVRA